MQMLQDFFPLIQCFIPLILIGIVLRIWNRTFFSFRGILFAVLVGFLPLPLIIVLQTLPWQNLSYVPRIFIMNGVIEESVKMGFLFFLPYKKIPLKIFFISAIIAGISLSSFETAVYMLSDQQNILLRILTALPLHGVCAGLSSFFVWSVRTEKRTFFPFLAAVLLHTLYNFFAGFTGIIWWFSLACIGLAISLCARFYEQARDSQSLQRRQV